jgi:hypothetical protein
VIEVPLTQGKIALVDDEDEWVTDWKWRAKSSSGDLFYAARNSPRPSKKEIWMHREIMLPPPGLEIDHVNGNGLDNRRLNLRLATSSQNKWNAKKSSGNTASIYKGVSVSRQGWRAQIRCNGGRYHLGVFKTAEEAAEVYNAAALELFGEYACLNVIKESV